MNYEKDVLKKLQLLQCDMLKQFDKVCQKYNISYFAIWGTAIGAMRHNGFIPWDDDIDIGILRDDYEKLKSVSEAELGDNILVFPDDGVNYHRLCFPRLYRKNTLFSDSNNVSSIISERNEHITPIWIDIQFFDRISDYADIRKISKKKIKYRKLYRVSKSNHRIDFHKGIHSFVRTIFRRGLYLLLHIRNNPQDYYYRKYLECCDNLGNLITNFDTLIEKEMYTSCCKYEDVFPLKKVQFEDFEINVPNNVEAILNQIYGDYRVLPPVEKRKNHAPCVLDFGDGVNCISRDQL